MKKTISLFLVVFLLIFLVLPAFAQDVRKTDSTGTESAPSLNASSQELKKASRETVALAETAVQKLQEKVVFAFLESSTEEMYKIAKYVAPELLQLETKEDAALALIELYDNLLVELRVYDLDAYFVFGKYDMEHAATEGLQKASDAIQRGRVIFKLRRTIEGLLALDCYYNLLDEQEIQRMLNDFEEFSALEVASASKVYETVSTSTDFEKFRGIKTKGGLQIISDKESNDIANNSKDENPSGDFYSQETGVYYSIGSSLYTTSGNTVTTLYALSEMADNLKQHYYDCYSVILGLTYVSSATSFYNCHEFAWNSIYPTRKWINKNTPYQGTMLYGVDRYIDDNHCTYLGNTDNVVQVGDIIVYYNNSGIAHSGIVVGTNPIRIESKWGPGCVWIHDKDQVPNGYLYYINGSPQVNAKYFRYAREHDFTYQNYNSIKHRATCTVCGYSRLEAHYYMLDPDVCDFCGYVYHGGMFSYDGENEEWECHECTGLLRDVSIPFLGRNKHDYCSCSHL